MTHIEVKEEFDSRLRYEEENLYWLLKKKLDRQYNIGLLKGVVIGVVLVILSLLFII